MRQTCWRKGLRNEKNNCNQFLLWPISGHSLFTALNVNINTVAPQTVLVVSGNGMGMRIKLPGILEMGTKSDYGNWMGWKWERRLQLRSLYYVLARPRPTASVGKTRRQTRWSAYLDSDTVPLPTNSRCANANTKVPHCTRYSDLIRLNLGLHSAYW